MHDALPGRRPAISHTGLGRLVVPRPIQLDLALGAAIAALNLAAAYSLVDPDGLSPQVDLIAWVLSTTPAVCIALRRVRPLSMLAIASVLTMWSWALGLPNVFMAATVLIYSAVVHGPRPIGLRAAIVAGVALTSFTLLGVFAADIPLYVVGLVGLMAVAAITLGSGMADRDAYAREVEQSARETAAHRLTRESAVLAEERNRLARELHDVVAHGLAVISIQASAAERMLDRDLTAARTSLDQIQRTSRDALAEMRRVLVALRADDDPTMAPTPGVDALEALVIDVCDTGLDVELALESGLLHDRRNGVVGLTVFRFVQEALTNVIKHAGPGATAAVRVQSEGAGIRVEVTDTGRGLAARPSENGHGLTGMRERADLLGGTFRSGPRTGGGFRVTAWLPAETVGS